MLLYSPMVSGLFLLLPILSNAAAATDGGFPSLGLSVFSVFEILACFGFLFYKIEILYGTIKELLK